MKSFIRVTEKELANILFNTTIIEGMPMFASVLQGTEPKLTTKNRVTKEPRTFDKVVKLSKVGILLNTDYTKAVTNQLKKEDKSEGDYIKGKNTMVLEFGEKNQFIGLYGDRFVIQYRPNDNVKPKSKFIMDGKITSKSKLVDFLPKETVKAENQGTDREIFWRKLYLSNVRKLTLNGVTYKLIH
jgi:hypothetical protein